METLIVINLIMTAVLLALVVRQQFRQAPSRLDALRLGVAMADASVRATKPIRHPKVEGPTTSQAMRGVGYWRPKGEPSADAILACWYEKDTTPDRMTELDSSEAVIPADTYVDLTGRRIPGPKFRTYYEPAEEVMVVSKVKPKTKLRNTNLVSGGAQAAQLTPEEEERLAEEYELGGHVAERRS